MHPENLKKGEWIIVTGKKPSPEYIDFPFPMMTEKPSGVPLKIRSISLPFIATMPATYPNTLSIIDIREEQIVYASKEYVRTFKDTYNLNLGIAEGTIKQGPLV